MIDMFGGEQQLTDNDEPCGHDIEPKGSAKCGTLVTVTNLASISQDEWFIRTVLRSSRTRYFFFAKDVDESTDAVS